MKALFVSLVLLPNWQCLAQRIPNTASPTLQSDESQAHEIVMKFLQGLRIAQLSEGKRLLAETQWILGQADRGANFYSRPYYTEVTSLFASLFDTDVPSVRGFKEMFAMKAVTKGGTTRNLKYLVIAFKDADSGSWKLFSTHDDADGESSVDVERQVEFFKSVLADTRYTSARDHFASYGDWLLRSGRIRAAKLVLEAAKKVSPASGISKVRDPIRDIQIDAVLAVIAKIAPQTTTP